MIPRFAEIRQALGSPRDENPAASVVAATRALAAGIRPGSRVAVACGSRGIAAIAQIVTAAVGALRDAGHRPFLVPAMGSHGGATAAGQRALLAGYGIDEASAGAPIHATMEVRLVGETPEGVPAFMDAAALEADAILPINRIKPHTTLRGELGSGLVKMLAVGLGNQVGADTLHSHGLQRHIVPVARVLIARAPVCGGIGIIENAAGEVAHVRAVGADAIVDGEPALLKLARSYMPRIAISPLDVLVVRVMGKNISGTGMDPNVIGMHRRHGGEPDRAISTIAVLDLSAESHGNATGIGMADVTTVRLRERIDWPTTTMNCLTGKFLQGLKMPLTVGSDREALEVSARLHGAGVRMAIVRDTLHLGRYLVSENLLSEALATPGAVLSRGPAHLPFTDEGSLVPDPLGGGPGEAATLHAETS